MSQAPCLPGYLLGSREVRQAGEGGSHVNDLVMTTLPPPAEGLLAEEGSGGVGAGVVQQGGGEQAQVQDAAVWDRQHYLQCVLVCFHYVFRVFSLCVTIF